MPEMQLPKEFGSAGVPPRKSGVKVVSIRPTVTLESIGGEDIVRGRQMYVGVLELPRRNPQSEPQFRTGLADVIGTN
jgi:hypothetical protein